MSSVCGIFGANAQFKPSLDVWAYFLAVWNAFLIMNSSVNFNCIESPVKGSRSLELKVQVDVLAISPHSRKCQRELAEHALYRFTIMYG